MNWRRSVGLLLVLALALACDDEPQPEPYEPPATVWVDSLAADGGDGTADRPLRTLAEAVDTVATGGTVHMARGTYLEQVAITRAVTLSADEAGVELDGTDGPALSIRADGPVRLIDLTVTGINATGDRLVIDGATLRGGDQPAVEAAGVELIIDGGALFDSPADGIVLEGGSLDLRAMTIERVTGRAIAASEAEIFVRDTVVRDGQGIAIWLEDSESTLSDVTIEDVISRQDGADDGQGVSVWGGTVTLSDSTIARVATRGVVVRGAELTIEGSEIAGAGLTAIAVMADLDGVPSEAVIRDCGFQGNATDVFASGSDLHVVGNHSEEAGMTVLADHSTMVIERNVFEGAFNGFISLLSPGETVIRDNRGVASDQACVFVAGASGDVVVENNTLNECHGHAISISESTGVTVTQNAINDVLADLSFPQIADGISLIDTEGTVHGNTLRRVRGTGIHLVRMEGSVRDNTIDAPGSAGIQLNDCAQEVRVEANQIEDATGAGILSLNSAVYLLSNETRRTRLDSDGLGDGLALADASVGRVERNTAEDNAVNGLVALGGVLATVSDNRFIRNEAYGIRVHCTGGDRGASDVTIGENDLDGNGRGSQLVCE